MRANSLNHPSVRQEGLPIDAGAAETLRLRFRGELLRPGDERYDAARKIWNGSIDRYPALIARCRGTADVMAAVRFARERDLLVAARGGGHNVAGNAVCDGGIVIDLSPMKGIRVDPARRRAWVQPGVVWGELDHETQAFGLATPGGIMSTTGVAGFTLGGGIGWLMRKYGLACDNLRAAEVITADGQRRTASEEEHPDLFWGLRGGGGNFGIVTGFEFELHPVGPTVLAGLVFHPLARAREFMRFVREFVATAPDELTAIVIMRQAPQAAFLPPEVRGTPVVALGVCYSGPVDEGERVVRPVKAFAKPLVDLIRPMRFVDFQQISDGSWAPGFQNYWKSTYLAGLPDAAIEALVDFASTITSPLSDMKIAHQGGAVARIAEEATAFGNRHASLNLNINTRWTDSGEADRHIAWTRALFDAMQPFSTGGVYINFLGDEGEDRVRAAYGPRIYERLVALKSTYDPRNLFRLNQNIKPTVQTTAR